MIDRPFKPRRESLTAAVQAIVKDTAFDEDEASRQLEQAIREGQLRVYFVGRSSLRRTEFESIDWNSINVRNSTINYKPHDAKNWAVLLGGPGMAMRAEIEIAERRRLWPAQPAVSGKRGRPPNVDWEGDVRKFVHAQLDHHGWPDGADPEWKSQADVERAVARHIRDAVGESQIRDHTKRLMAEWLSSKAGK